MFLGVDLMNINDVKTSLISEIEKLVEIIKKEYPNLFNESTTFVCGKLYGFNDVENGTSFVLYINDWKIAICPNLCSETKF